MKSNKYLSRISWIGCGLTIGMGVIALLGWLSGLRLLASINSSYIPMAPNTAVAFIILGVAILVLHCLPHYHIFRWLSAFISMCVTVLGILVFIKYFHETAFDINQLVLKYSGETLGNIPVGSMSPLTAGNFLLAGASLFLLSFPSFKKPIRNIASCLATTVTLIGGIVLFGYLYGTPLLYGGFTTPMAINTACAFICVGISLMGMAGLECIPASYFTGVSVRARLMRGFFPLLVLTTIFDKFMLDLFVAKELFNPAAMVGLYAVLSGGIIGVVVFLISRMVGNSIDCAETMRTRTEEALRESEERFRTMFENNNDGIILADKQTRIFRYANPAICSMTGYSKDELTQMGLRDIHPEQDLPHVIEEFELSAKGEKNINPNIPVKRRDGGIFYADIRTTTLLLNGKEYLMGVFRDITERKQADEKLRKITESVFDAIVMIDQNGKINYWNTAAEAIFGYTKNEAMGKDVHTLLLPEDYAESYRDGMKTFKTNGTGNIISKRVILPARRKDGSQFYAEHSFASFQSDNDWNAVSVIRDYTEQKRYEDALKKLNETLERRVTERAKELNEMRWQLYHVQKLDSIGRLAGGVAHDFNNILMAIIGYASLAELGLAEGNPAREYIKKILESSNKATNLTQSLLAFSRRQPVSLESVNLKGIINDMEQLLFKTAGEKIDCRLMLSDQDLKAKDVNVMADRDKIEQVLMNLAMNAVDAMPAGGTLTISTDIVMLDSNSVKRYGLDKEGAYGVITVSDTGIGMNEETKSKIFEPFFTTKERGKGTGIGLSIAYGIIKQHNGHIEVISAPGKGTTFNIYLPITEREVMKRNTSDTHIPVSTGIRTILLAEDERDVREVVTKILERSGYRVISAINGDDAIKKFEENKDRVDMLVFDVMMPKMNGKEAYNIIKELNPGMKILFMSGHSEDNSINKEIREEGLLFIQKPVIPDKLLKKIKEAFVV